MPAWLVTLLYPMRPGEPCPVAATNASSDVAATEIRLSLVDGEVVALDEGKLWSHIRGSATRYVDYTDDAGIWKAARVHLDSVFDPKARAGMEPRYSTIRPFLAAQRRPCRAARGQHPPSVMDTKK
jgi:hypothetical protein